MKADADAKARQEKAATRQEKSTAELKAAHADMKAAQAEMEARGEARQVEMNADLIAEIEVGQREILSLFRGSRTYGKGMTTCQTETTSCSEEMEATNLEATPEETEAAVERQDFFKEETYSENIGSSEDRSGYRRLVVRRRRGAKKRTQDNVGSRLKLSDARKRVIRRAVPSERKGNMRKGPGKDSTARRAPKERRLVKIRWKGHECNIGLRNRGPKNQLHLRLRRTSSRNYRKPIQLEKKKRIFGSTNGLRRANKLTFWKVRPPPKPKKELRTA
jgi:hypothetical protein